MEVNKYLDFSVLLLIITSEICIVITNNLVAIQLKTYFFLVIKITFNVQN